MEAYANELGHDPGPRPAPMGFFPDDQVPITSSLARNYCTCDNWFSALPSSTQPNRTIAFCGASEIFDTKTRLIPCRDILFDWLDRHRVRWRVYHDGLSFFVLYRHAWNHVLGPRFRDYEYLYRDMVLEPVETAPQVIVIEPSYEDAPHFGPDHPNDNHAPLAVGWGEEFLRRTYEAVIANPVKWESTVFIVYYDEHGGFWDHVPPPRIRYATTGDPAHTFESLGPRIPGIVVSPLVEVGAVSHALLDHTSVLQFLAELFSPGEPYSPDVETRQEQGIESITGLITRESPRPDTPPVSPEPIPVTSALGEAIVTPPQSGMEKSFELAAQAILTERPEATEKYPELVQWQVATKTARS